MKDYDTVSGANLAHVIIRQLLALNDKTFELDKLYTDPPETVPLTKLFEVFKTSKIHTKLVAGGADGAGCNFGKHIGMMTMLKEEVPWLLSVHCFAHRLELAAADAFSGIFGEIDDFLKDLYYIFKNSPKQWCLLLRIAERLQIAAFKPPKSFGTR